MWVLGLHLDPPEEQHTRLTTESSLHPPMSVFLTTVFAVIYSEALGKQSSETGLFPPPIPMLAHTTDLSATKHVMVNFLSYLTEPASALESG